MARFCAHIADCTSLSLIYHFKGVRYLSYILDGIALCPFPQGSYFTAATKATRSVVNASHAAIKIDNGAGRGAWPPQRSGFPTCRNAAGPEPVLRVRCSAARSVTSHGHLARSSSLPCPSGYPRSSPPGLDQWGSTQGTVRDTVSTQRRRSQVFRSPASAQSAAPGSPLSGTQEAGEEELASMESAGTDGNASSMGGQPPVAMITTIGCPYCRKVSMHAYDALQYMGCYPNPETL